MERFIEKEKMKNHSGQVVKGKAGKLQYLLIASCYLLCVVFAVFTVQCELDSKPVAGQELPAGYGAFTLALGDNVARTILPTAPALGAFTFYRLEFIPVDIAATGGEARNIVFENTGTTSPTYVIVAGTYDITLSAYLGGNIDAPTNLAARATITDVEITPGGLVERDITLKAILKNGDGRSAYNPDDTEKLTGTFYYSVGLNTTGVTTATMVIMQGATKIDVTLSTLNNSTSQPMDPIPLDVGLYTVEVTLEKAQERAVWNEILYVYSSLQSRFVRSFNNDFFHRTHYNVTLKYYNEHYINHNNPTANFIQSVAHAGVLGDIPAPARPGFRFDGWFLGLTYTGGPHAATPTDAALTAYTHGDEWNPASDPVLNDMTLSAGWTPNKAAITIDLDVSALEEKAPTIDNITLSRTGATPYTQAANVTITGTYDTDSLNWRIRRVYTDDPDQQYETGTGTPIPLDATNIYYNSLGWHTVEVSVKVSGLEYQRSFRFRIVE